MEEEKQAGIAPNISFEGVPRGSAGLKAIAVLEGAKGVLALAFGAGVISISRLASLGDPDGEFPFPFKAASAHGAPDLLHSFVSWIGSENLWLIGVCAIVYAGVRLIEAYGLWREMGWAEWFAAVSAAIYIPIELYELFQRVMLITIVILTINIVLVAYLSWKLNERSSRHRFRS